MLRPMIIHPCTYCWAEPIYVFKVVCHLHAPIHSRTVVACELAIGLSHQGDNETPFRPIQRRLSLYNPLKCLRSRFIPSGKPIITLSDQILLLTLFHERRWQ